MRLDVPQPAERPRHGRSGRDPRRMLAVGTMALAMLAPPQFLGGIEGWAIAVTAGLCLLALASAQAAVGRTIPLDYRRPVLVVMAAGVLWTAVQALPLPCSLVALLASPAAEHVLANRELLGDPSVGACTLSWAPGPTRWEMAKGTAIAAAFLSAWLLTVAGLRRHVLMAVAASAVLMALVGLAHLATGAERVFGLYAPRYAMPRPVLAPLLNPNQLSGFLAMGVPVLAALGLATRDRGQRALWMAGAVLCGTTVILTLSRGGWASLLAGMLFLGALAWKRKTRGSRRGRELVWVGATLCLIAIAGAYLALGPVAREFTDGDLSKLEVIASAASFAMEHPWLGVGRGAFGAAFAQAGGLADYRADHAENVFVHWTAEWGLPLTVALLVGIALALRSAVGQARSMPRAGALAAVGSIAVHDLVDFSLELTGVAVVAAAVLGAAVSRRGPRRVRRPPLPVPWRRTAVPWVAGAAAILLLSLPALVRGSVRSLHDDLAQALEADARDRFAGHLRHAVALHPSEPTFALLAATEAVRHGDPSAPRWLNRAMALAPSWPGPHLVAAQWLWVQGAHPQAMLELRQAAERSPGATRPFLCQVLRGHPDDAAALIAQATPGGPLRVPFLEVAATCLGPRSPAAVVVDELLLSTQPDLIRPLLRRTRRLMDTGDLEGALHQLGLAVRRHPRAAEVRLALAEAQVAAGGPEAALATIRQAEGLPGDRRALVRARASALAALGDHDAMGETLQELRGLSRGSSEQVAKALAFEGALWERHGHPAQALRAYEEAHRVAPRRDRLERVAAAAQALGDRPRAFRAYLELCQTHPEVERYCKRKDRLRHAMDDGASALSEIPE